VGHSSETDPSIKLLTSRGIPTLVETRNRTDNFLCPWPESRSVAWGVVADKRVVLGWIKCPLGCRVLSQH
jgi:hypothetical protein